MLGRSTPDLNNQSRGSIRPTRAPDNVIRVLIDQDPDSISQKRHLINRNRAPLNQPRESINYGRALIY